MIPSPWFLLFSFVIVLLVPFRLFQYLYLNGHGVDFEGPWPSSHAVIDRKKKPPLVYGAPGARLESVGKSEQVISVGKGPPNWIRDALYIMVEFYKFPLCIHNGSMDIRDPPNGITLSTNPLLKLRFGKPARHCKVSA